MRELTKTKAKARTITGTVRVIGTENFDLVSDRFLRMADEITREYGLTIGRGVLRCVGVVSISRDLTITGLEQAETVAEKWTRALDTVSAEYGLQCEWEEQAVVERSQGVASWVENRRSIPCTVKGVQIGGVEYSPMALEKIGKAGIEGAKAGDRLRAKFAQVGMSGIMGNQVRYTVEQAREREKLTAMLLKLGVDAGDVSNERLAEIHREAMSGKTSYWDSSKPDIMGNLERGMEQMLSTPTPKAAEAMEKMGVRTADAEPNSDDVKIRELADEIVMAGGADSVSHAEGIIRTCLKPRPPYDPMTGDKLAKALAAVSPTGRGGASHRNESLDIRNWGSPFETPEGAKLREHERALKAACSGGANNMSSMMDRIGDLPGVVSVRAICNELGTAVVSLWVEEGPFHYDATKCEIEAMLPLGVELRLEAEAAWMVTPTDANPAVEWGDISLAESRRKNTLSQKDLVNRIEHLTGVVSLREITSKEDGSLLVSLIVDESEFSFVEAGCQIQRMIPTGVELHLKAEAARMVDADMESSDAPCWTALKAPPTSYADTPTGTVAWDEKDGSELRHWLEKRTLPVQPFKYRLHLTKNSVANIDLHCPCCGSTDHWPRFSSKNVGELLKRGGEDSVYINQIKAGITCDCGVKSTYDFESEIIKLELVKS